MQTADTTRLCSRPFPNEKGPGRSLVFRHFDIFFFWPFTRVFFHMYILSPSVKTIVKVCLDIACGLTLRIWESLGIRIISVMKGRSEHGTGKKWKEK